MLVLSQASLAEERKSKNGKSGEALDQELSELDDADYPDLVSADDEGEIIDEFAFLAEEAVVESAARHKQQIGMSPSAITVITHEDIEASGANSIPDLLRMVPGMDVVITTPFNTAITARLYWTNENNHFLVLVDGREANVELLGQSAWELQPVFIEDVERIEVIRGPGSSLYGANAVAGVVSITTKRIPETTSGWARILAGEPGAMSAGAWASTRVGRLGISLSGGGDVSRSYDSLEEFGKRIWKVRSLIEYRLSDSERLLLDAGLSGGKGSSDSAIGIIAGDFHLRTVRLAYESENLSGQLYWIWMPIVTDLTAPLDYGGIRLARFVPNDTDMQTIDAEVQWTLPKFYDPLLIIVGGGGRLSNLASDDMLDGKTFTDITSPRYHQPGIDHWETRLGAFVHAELAPAEWLTITGGLRLDYNTITELFASPRLAMVFRPVEGQYIRMGVARAFRKPAAIETVCHPNAEFPPESPITGEGQQKFLEFLTRVAGNSELGAEKVLAFELGYLGQFLDDRLSVFLDLYYNIHTDVIVMNPQIVEDQNGLPDLDRSSFIFDHTAPDLTIIGAEMGVRFNVTKNVVLLASWNHRELFKHILESQVSDPTNPKNLLTLGGRFRTSFGLLGSLYAFSRSEFYDWSIGNPNGLLEPLVEQHMDNVLLIMGKLGWRWGAPGDIQFEAGAKLFLPVSPFSGPLFRFYEKGGGITLDGVKYGGVELSRAVTAYLQGSY